MGFIERRRLMGRGIGYIDVHLLASVALTRGSKLRTRDKRLAAIADELVERLRYRARASSGKNSRIRNVSSCA